MRAVAEFVEEITHVSPEAAKEKGFMPLRHGDMPAPTAPHDPLPRRAREKLQRALAEKNAAHAAYLAVNERLHEIRRQASLIERTQRDMHESRTDIGHAELARLSVERGFATEAQERAEQRSREFGFIGQIEDWIKRSIRFGVQAKLVEPPVMRSKDFRKDLALVRAEILGLEQEWDAVEAAPVPAHVLKADALAEINRTAAEGALKISTNCRDGSPLDLGRRLSTYEIRSGGPSVGDNGASLFTWLLRDALVARVDELVGTLDLTGAMTDHERASAFERIAADRLAAERREEALITSAGADGIYIPRRQNIDPRAFLEIEI